MTTTISAVSVDLQRALAARLGARTTELKASHMSILSRPQAVAEAIAQAAAWVAAARRAQTDFSAASGVG